MSYLRTDSNSFTTSGPEESVEIKDGRAVTLHTYMDEGTEAAVRAQKLVRIAEGATRVRMGPDGDTGLWRLEASFPFGEEGETAEEPQDVHEIEVTVEQIPIWNSERLRDHITDADIAIVKKYGEMFLSGAKWDGYTTGSEPSKADYITQMKTETTDDTDAETLFNRFVSGTESALEFREVYRRTITAATFGQVQASYTGSGLIWTTAEVEAFEGIPTDEWFGLEAGMQWLKAPPTVQAVAGGRTQIQYYYTGFKRASNLFYQAYSSATLLD